MGHKKRTYQIEEVVTGNPPEQQLRLLSDGQVLSPSVPIIFNKTTDGMRKVDHYRIRFEIKNFSSSRLRFVPSTRDVFWVQKGTTCPTSFCELPGIIWVDKVDDDGEWIDLINMDLQRDEFQFTLNFVEKTVRNPTEDDYVALDPGGGNEDQGGSGSGFTSSYAAIGVGTVAFAAFIAYGFGLFGNQGFMPSTAYVLVAVGTLCFAAFAAYLSGMFER